MKSLVKFIVFMLVITITYSNIQYEEVVYPSNTLGTFKALGNYIYFYSDSGMQYSKDYGKNWSKITSPNKDNIIKSFEPTEKGLYILYSFNHYDLSKDQMITDSFSLYFWNKENVAPTNNKIYNFNFIKYSNNQPSAENFEIFELDDNKKYILYNYCETSTKYGYVLYKLTNDSAKVQFGFTYNLGIKERFYILSIINENTIYAIRNDSIVISINSGQTWDIINYLENKDIVFSINEQILIETRSGDSYLHHTQDFGKTTLQIDSIKSIAEGLYLPSGEAYLCHHSLDYGKKDTSKIYRFYNGFKEHLNIDNSRILNFLSNKKGSVYFATHNLSEYKLFKINSSITNINSEKTNDFIKINKNNIYFNDYYRNIELYNNNGALVRKYTGNSNNFSLENLNDGIYFLILNMEDKQLRYSLIKYNESIWLNK